jgi:hypothetical protein
MRFFFDRNMPPQLARMVDALEREHTARSYYDDDRFTDATPDVEWITIMLMDSAVARAQESAALRKNWREP